MQNEHEERIRELLLIQRVAQRISSILDLDQLLEEIVSDVCRTFGYGPRSWVLRRNAESPEGLPYIPESATWLTQRHQTHVRVRDRST